MLRSVSLVIAIALGLLITSPAPAQEGVTPTQASAVEVPPPGQRDVCPVCGMFVAKYPEWVATVVYSDGHAHFFDGAKDMFKFLHDVPKYGLPGHTAADIAIVAVTDYYDVRTIDAHDAFYVIGSDVYGPMGHELVPLASEADADAFMKDHKGRRVLRFDEVTAQIPVNLDKGLFE